MRLRDALEVAKNLARNITIDGSLFGIPVKLSGDAVLEIHQDSIWVTNILTDSFLKARILWEDFQHEFQFVPASERGKVCHDALRQSASALEQARKNAPAATKAQYTIIDLISAAETCIDLAAKGVITDRDDYNRYVRDTGGDGEEEMTEREHLQSLLQTVRRVRSETYPLWSALTDLLPEGATKARSQEALKIGSATSGLDADEVTSDWRIAQE